MDASQLVTANLSTSRLDRAWIVTDSCDSARSEPRHPPSATRRPPSLTHSRTHSRKACSVNVFRPGWSHAWHFDEAEYTTTLCLQQAEVGGEFLYTPPLRTRQADLECAQVAAVLREHSEYKTADAAGVLVPSPPIRAATFEPGTLQIFGGRYCLHCVAPTKGQRDRLVAVLCFATSPGVVNSAQVQQMFWGRTVD